MPCWFSRPNAENVTDDAPPEGRPAALAHRGTVGRADPAVAESSKRPDAVWNRRARIGDAVQAAARRVDALQSGGASPPEGDLPGRNGRPVAEALEGAGAIGDRGVGVGDELERRAADARGGTGKDALVAHPVAADEDHQAVADRHVEAEHRKDALAAGDRREVVGHQAGAADVRDIHAVNEGRGQGGEPDGGPAARDREEVAQDPMASRIPGGPIGDGDELARARGGIDALLIG